MNWIPPLGLSALLTLNLFMVFSYAPVERTMGMVQKIFYFHVASAWIGFLAFFVVFVTSILYLRHRREQYHHLSLASAEIGTLFTTLVLLTGPLWARPVWNTWWTWDLRLTSTLVMWFMYLGYLVLQHAINGAQRARLMAVYGIVAFANVPLVFFSIRWWRSIHPVVIRADGSGLTAEMTAALMVSLATFFAVYVYFLRFRFKLLELQARLKDCLHHVYGEEQS